MISNQNAQLGLEVADALGKRKLHLSVLMSEVYNHSTSPAIMDDLEKDLNYTALDPEAISESSRVRGLDERVQHDLAMEDLVAKGVGGINGIVDLVTNVVNPWATETRAAIDEMARGVIESNNPPIIVSNFLLNFDSVPFLLDAIIENKATTRKRNIKAPREIILDSDYMEGRTDTEIFALVSSGNVLIDTFLKSIIPMAKNTSLSFGTMREDENAAYQVLHWAYLNKVLENPPESLDMALSEYRLVVSALKRQVAREADIAIRLNERRVNSGYLFSRIPAKDLTDYRIRVYGDTYNKWIAAGGSIEALYGVILLGQSNKPVKDLTDYAGYEERYAFYKTVISIRVSAKFKELANQIAISKLESYRAKEMPDASPRAFELHIKKNLKALENPCATNIDMWLRKVFCVCCASNESVFNFILELSEVGKSNPNLKLSECAELARVHITADWLATLVIPPVE